MSEDTTALQTQTATSQKATAAADTAPAAASKQPNNPVIPKKASSLGRLLASLGLGALLGAGVLAWLGYQKLVVLQQELALKPSSQQVEQQQQASRLLEARLTNIEQQGLEASNQVKLLAEQQAKFDAVQAQFNQQLQSLSQVHTLTWQLGELEYLLRRAQQRLVFEQDTAGALGWARWVSHNLHQLDKPEAATINALLQQEIQQVAQADLDRPGLAKSLQSLANQALQLPVQTLPSLSNVASAGLTQAEQELSKSATSWYARLWQDLRGLIIVRQREMPIAALPYTAEELAQRQQLSALLLQAAWAGLLSEQALFSYSLEAATQRVRNLDLTQPVIQAFAQELEQLAQIQVAPAQADFQASLHQLQHLLKQSLATATESTVKPAVVNELED